MYYIFIVITMAKLCTILFATTAFLCCERLFAQGDSTLESLQQIPSKYISTIDKKIDKYSSRISKKTIRTLEKLGKWETKIKSNLEKLSPETANKLFGNDQLTFAGLLQKLKQGEAIRLQYEKQYDKYRDNLTTNIQYIEKQKAFIDSGLAKKINATRQKIQQLNSEEDSTQALQQFIKQRKKQLITAAFQYMGNSKYLVKMNKEVWYYAETMKNYKDIFSDEAQTEKLAKDILHKVPGFQQFVQKNSMLASLFGAPGDEASAMPVNPNLQTRAGIQSLIQQRIAAGGAGAQDIFKQNLKDAQSQLNSYKDKLLKAGSGAGTGDGGLPDFKPNMQKTKTFLQRLEWGSNLQFARNNSLMPSTMDIALTAGYKLNDKSTVGLGAGYKMGMGSIDKIRFTTQGISLRSFIDWKLKKQFYLSGGWEMNYLTDMPVVTTVITYGNGWQQAALFGLSKKFKTKTKWFKETKLQLLYDLLAKQHEPVSQPVLFRVGYNF